MHQKISNKKNFPYAIPSGIAGLVTIQLEGDSGTFGNPNFRTLPLFAPALEWNGYKKLYAYIDNTDTITGEPLYPSSSGRQNIDTASVYPPTGFAMNIQSSGGGTFYGFVFDCKQIPYRDLLNMLAGGDVLKITNIRLSYLIKKISSEMRDQVITFFSEDIFGTVDFQQLTIGQYFDPDTNKAENDDPAGRVETIDIPVEWFISNTSGVCIGLSVFAQLFIPSLSVTFVCEKYFNHPKDTISNLSKF